MLTTEATTPPSEQLFFSALNREAQGIPGANLAEQTADIAQGIAVVLRLVEASRIAGENDDDRVLGAVECGNLTRFAISAAQMLSERAQRQVEWFNQYGQQA
jgi:hypothetical protein